MFRWGIIFLCLSLVFGCSQANLPLKGNLIVKGQWDLPEGEPCKIANIDNVLKGKDPYLNAAIQRDLKVTVKNSKSKVVAIGSLGEARTVKDEGSTSSNCAFPLTVDNVPISDFYTISVGSIEQTLAKKDVEQGEARIYTENDALIKLVPQ